MARYVGVPFRLVAIGGQANVELVHRVMDFVGLLEFVSLDRIYRITRIFLSFRKKLRKGNLSSREGSGFCLSFPWLLRPVQYLINGPLAQELSRMNPFCTF
jgi:hypothetical protein